MAAKLPKFKSILGALRRSQGEAAIEFAEKSPSHAHFRAARGDEQVVDLLHLEPAITIDRQAVAEILRFAFVAGDGGVELAKSLRHAAVAPSTFEPQAFASGLFVGHLVDAMGATANVGQVEHHREFLARLVTHPPLDSRDVSFRQSIFAQVRADAAFAQDFWSLHAAWLELHAAFCVEESGRGAESRRRRIKILLALRAFIAAARSLFPAASSGLCRLRSWANVVEASVGYRAMSDLLDFDAKSASLEVRLTLGTDGRVRKLDFLRFDESDKRALTAITDASAESRSRHWLSSIHLAARGYRIGNDQIVEECLDAVFEGMLDVLLAVVQLAGDLAFYAMGMRFAEKCENNGLKSCLPTLVESSEAANDEPCWMYQNLFNPLLLHVDQGPIGSNIEIKPGTRTIVLTGPNSGGKTRCMQAFALAQLMAQCGLPVPASRARVKRVPGLFVSLLEDSAVDQKEGRLGMELLRIRRLFERARPGSLVLLDELCSGTNPDEGEEIFRMVLKLLDELRAQVWVATHFLDLVRRLAGETGQAHLGFLQVELDADENPTFHVVDGIARGSLAKQLAMRLGVTQSELQALVAAQLNRPAASDP
jgi:DNA mismatch repair protein MutS2